ncbi:BQ2448_3564 [Microbotryum intermedium]|uniref:uracil phosphoribosyltransferase n=1 Tax=Microbotryum intermedium TaxID=269621 RepID=A0A238FAC3_9BASI|nr:BQ2448_3564 [Microbotryum intermedium]
MSSSNAAVEQHTAIAQDALPANAYALQRTNQLAGLLTIIRDTKTTRGDFIFYSDRIIRLLVEEGLNHLPVVDKRLNYEGVGFEGKICGISIMRAGEAMEAGLRECCRAVRIGKILIQRDEETHQAKLFYAKVPDDIAQRYCLLLDPMLATGGSAIKAIEVLIDHGLEAMYKAYPHVRVVTAWIDECLNEKKYILPGLGDFGDRYFTSD